MEASKLGPSFGEPQQEVPVDWSDLPADLIATISNKLHDLFDFVYFRAVCKKWRTSTSISDLPPQFPWVLESHNNGHLHVYSLISGKTRTIHCPKSRDMRLYGPSHGYLYGETGKWKKILNPLTNDEQSFKLEKGFCGSMLCMCPDLMGSYDHIAFFDSNYEKMGFYQPRVREWCYVKAPLHAYGWCSNHICFKNYYINDMDVTDIASRSFLPVSVPHIFNTLVDGFYFVESAGKVLGIVKRFDDSSVSSSYSFDIYQLDLIDDNFRHRWLKISSVGDQILFLDRGGGISIAACETTGLGKNCIYWLQCCDNRTGEVQVHRYNIEHGWTEKIPPHLNLNCSWFVPRIVGSLSEDAY